MPAPLYEALRAFADTRPLRMHMPGHKGKPLPILELAGLSSLDFTELSPTGNLFEGGGPIEEAEALWAELFQMSHCLFLTGGSTQGILTALTLACSPGQRILLDRSSHRSAYHASALLDLDPIYLFRAPLPGDSAAGPISPEQVDQALEHHPEVKTVFITSPTYYGILSDLPTLAQAAHCHGACLVVDAAHGAHLPFLDDFSLSAADLLVASAHKTLPAPGQSALLFAGSRFEPGRIRRTAALYGSSSPSYPMMAALDCCRAWMEQKGRRRYLAAAGQVAILRQSLPSLSPSMAALDPCRLVIRTRGSTVQEGLEALGVYPEFADRDHIIFICTCGDTDADFQRLERALRAVLPSGQPAAVLCQPPPPERALSLRLAQFSPSQPCPLLSAQGRICACSIAPYPPGIPVVAPGERLTKKTIAYLKEIGYNMDQDIEVVSFP